MNKTLGRTLVGITGCLMIGVICYILKSGTPLWALILVVAMIEDIH
jgi:hypothetical protein